MPEIRTVTSGFEFVPETAAGDDRALSLGKIEIIAEAPAPAPSMAEFRRSESDFAEQIKPFQDWWVKTRGGTSPELAPFPAEAIEQAAKTLESITALTQSPEDERYRVANSTLAADIINSTPSEVYRDHDSVANAMMGKASSPKEFFDRLSKLYAGGLVPGNMAPLLLRHGMGDESPELERQIREMESAIAGVPTLFDMLPESMKSNLDPGTASLLKGGFYYFLKAVMPLLKSPPSWLKGVTQEQWDVMKEEAAKMPSLPEMSAYEAAKIAPMIVQGIKEGAPWAVALSGGTAAAALLATVLGHPEAGKAIAMLIPEMLQVGFQAGALANIGMIEWTQAYWDLVKEPFKDANGDLVYPNRRLALAVTAPIGAVNMALENLQWSTLLKPFGINMTGKGTGGKVGIFDVLKNPQGNEMLMPLLRATQLGIRDVLVGKKLGGLLAGTAAKKGAEYLADVGQESFEEGAQQAVTVLGEEIAKHLFAQVAGTKYEAQWKRLWPEVSQAVLSSAMGFAILQAPGATFQFAMEGKKISTELSKQTAAVDAIMRRVKGLTRSEAESIVSMAIEAENQRLEAGGEILNGRARLHFEKLSSIEKQENFQKRMEGTQAVDENGKPKVFFNGSINASVTNFAQRKIGGKNVYGKAYYFTSDTDIANDFTFAQAAFEEYEQRLNDTFDQIERWREILKRPELTPEEQAATIENINRLQAQLEADKAWEKTGLHPGIYPAYLVVKNAFDVSTGLVNVRDLVSERFGEAGLAVYDDLARSAAEFESRGNKPKYVTSRVLASGLANWAQATDIVTSIKNKLGIADDPSVDIVNSYLRSRGYDALKLGGEFEGDWAVFDPTQIVSPYNKGMFDPTGDLAGRPWTAKYLVDPFNPPKIDKPKVAIQTKDGSIYYHPENVNHVTAAHDLEIPNEEVASSGYLLPGGKYVKFAGIKLKGARGGGLTVSQYMAKVRKHFPSATDEQISASVAAIEAHAKTLGMTADEWLSNRLIDVETGTEPNAYELLSEAFASHIEMTSEARRHLETIKTLEAEAGANWKKKHGGKPIPSIRKRSYVTKHLYPALMHEWYRERFGDIESQTYFKEALKLYGRYFTKTSKGTTPIHVNQKTFFSIDVSTNCPNREMGFPCLYCYVDQARSLSTILSREGKRTPSAGKGVFEVIPYSDEILGLPDDLIRFINTQLGGMRVFSFGDFKPKDEVAIRKIFDHAKQKGLILKVITKNLDFVKKYAPLYENAVFNISTDFEHVTDATPVMKSLIDGGMLDLLSVAPRIEDAWKVAKDNPRIKIRYVATNVPEAFEAGADPRISVLTLYHGMVGKRLVDVLRQQDPHLFETLGEKWVKKLADEWENIVPHSEVSKFWEVAKKFPEKVCCQTGKCGSCPIHCGFKNAGVFEKMNVLLKLRDGVPLASTEWLDDGMAIIRAFKAADFPSLMHELGHVFRRDLSGRDLEIMEKFCGVKRSPDGTPIWTREAEERFAYGYEKYLADGVAPTEDLEGLFKRFQAWMTHLYTNMRDRLELTPEARAVYDRMFYRPEQEKKESGAVGEGFTGAPATIEDIIDQERNDDWQRRMIDAEPEEAAREARSGGKKRFAGLSAAYEVLRNRFFGQKDVNQLVASVECKRNRAAIAKAVGAKRWNAEARMMDEAIQLYIDIEGQKDYARNVRPKLNPHQQEVLDLALNLPQSVQPIVEKIKKTYKKLGTEAKHHEVINNLIDNYVNRMWDLKGKETNELLSKFQQKTRHAKHRVFTTILDGWLYGYELKVPGATNALRVYQMEIGRVLADRRFIEGMAKARTVDGAPLLSTRQLEGYKRIEHPNFKLWRYSGSTSAEYIVRKLHEMREVRGETSTPGAPGMSRGMAKIREVVKEALTARGFSSSEADWYINKVGNAETPEAATAAISEVTKVISEKEVIDHVTFRKVAGKNYVLLEDGTILERYDLYAPEEYAKDLNNILGTSKIKDIGVIKAISKFNATFKTLLFAASLFQHMDFIRGALFGSWGSKGLALNPVRFTKLGLKAIENLEPAIVQGVRNGLTLFNKVDWEGEVFDETGRLGEILDKWKPTAELRRAAKTIINSWSEFLFNTLGAGLKAKSYLIIMQNEIKNNPHEDIDSISMRVAQMVNENFGGLHFERMGRNPTAQHILRILMLAPDWTESSIRKYLGAFGFTYGRGMGLRKLSPETRIMYQKMVFGSLLKGLAATVFANFLLAGGDPERFIEGYLQALDDGNLSFLDMNITPLYEAIQKGLGIEPTGQRKYFSLLGYYKDPIKWVRFPLKSLKYRASVGTSMVLEAITRTDWAGRSFVTLRELLESGQTVKMYPKEKSVADWDWLPAYILNQLIGLSPIPIQQAIAYAMGEQEGLDAIINATGLGVRTTY